NCRRPRSRRSNECFRTNAFGRNGDQLSSLCVDLRIELRQLFDAAAAWEEFGTYPVDEQAARLHHRLTWIHPFPNGNGRTARAMADIFLASRSTPAFSWGANTGLAPHEIRTRYLAAVRAADAQDLAPLLAFVRS